MQAQALLRGGGRILRRELDEQAFQQKRLKLGAQRSSIELGDVENSIEQPVHHRYGLRQIADDGFQLRSNRAPLQRRTEQIDRMQRLPQVMARGRNEA